MKKSFLSLFLCFAAFALSAENVVSDAARDVNEPEDNPLYYRLFMPLTFYNDAVTGITDENDSESSSQLIADDEELRNQINHVLLQVYQSNPELVQRTEAEVEAAGAAPASVPTETRLSAQAASLQDAKIVDAAAPDMVVNKPNYWKHPGESQIKYTQSHYSSNWYKGGDNNHSLLVQLTQEMNYAKNQLTFDNKLEAKLGYYTTQIDDKTSYKTNEDLLRFTSKFGLKAFTAWYYSAQVQGYTQFMKVEDNDGNLKSKFMAPAYGTLSLGMDYKPKFKNSDITLSVLISPLSLNMRYVSDEGVKYGIEKKFGIEPGENFMRTIGSKVDANWSIKFLNDFKWTAKAQYFTNYEYVESNFENTLDYSINKYFSLQFFFHWRFDDSVTPDEDLRYNQYKEFLTLNFKYQW